MLRTVESTFARIASFPLAESATNQVEEGACMVVGGYDSSGRMYVQPSGGTNNDDHPFVGFALSEITSLNSLVSVETVDLEGGSSQNTLTLEHAPSSDPSFQDVTGGDLVVGQKQNTAGAVDEDGDWNITGNVLTYEVATDGKVTLVYRYTPTIVDIRRVQGDVHPGVHVTQQMGMVSVVQAGNVLLDNFNTVNDWSQLATAHPKIYTGANGRITTASTTNVEIDALIYQQPRNMDSAGGAALMGISFSV